MIKLAYRSGMSQEEIASVFQIDADKVDGIIGREE